MPDLALERERERDAVIQERWRPSFLTAYSPDIAAAVDAAVTAAEARDESARRRCFHIANTSG
jgi:hypothetical protein